jgi:soluble lytic murein transglycosylase-like protein
MSNNTIMKIFTFIQFALSVCSLLSSTAHADVLINLEDTEEVSISNTQVNAQYTIKIEEPEPLLATGNAQIKTVNSIKINQLPYNDEVLLAAKLTSLEPALIHAVIAVESKHNARASSKKGAYGLMQLMPATAQRFKVRDKSSAKQNVLAGAQYLRELLTVFNGDLNLSLAAYNAGPGAVYKYGGRIPPYKETLEYVPKVLRYYRQYS